MNHYDDIVRQFIKNSTHDSSTPDQMDQFLCENALQAVMNGFIVLLIRKLPKNERKDFVDSAIRVMRQTLIAEYDDYLKDNKDEKAKLQNYKEDFVLRVNRNLQKVKKKIEEMIY